MINLVILLAALMFFGLLILLFCLDKIERQLKEIQKILAFIARNQADD